jgi:peptide/nickel transport system substrate-binding protein
LREIKVADEGEPTKPAAKRAEGGSYPRRVVFVLDKEHLNPLVVLDELAETRIVPRHVIEPLLAGVNGDINEFLKLKFDKDPIGSGPYRLLSYSSEKIVTVRNDAYWGNQALYGGKLPGPKYVVHPIYKSNDHFSVALQQGRLDASSTFVPRIWLKHKKGVHSWYEKEPFFLSASIPMLIPNVTHRPLNDVAMRRAMAYAINYRDIRELAVSGYSEPLKPGLILPFGLESKFYSEEDAQKYGASFDPERAKALLRDAGYRPVWGEGNNLVETRDAQGNKVPTVFIKSPTGWSDWESIVRIVVKSLRAVGIDARERFVDAGLFWPALFVGDFDLIMQTPSPMPEPSKPWSRFEGVLSSADWAPEGEKMYKNWGRFNNPRAPDYIPRVDELIRIIPALTDEKERAAAYRELNVLYMQQQPTLPLVYRPDQFYEFSVRHWKNFPTAENPVEPPQVPGDRLGTKILWQLEPVGTN